MKISTPSIGTRFLFRDSEFEICFVGHGICRYSAVIGGRTYQIPYSQFEDYCDSGLIKYEFDSSKSLIDTNLTANIVRKFKYIYAALSQLKYPTAIEPLSGIINKISSEIQDNSPPHPRTVARWIRTYQLNCNNTNALEKKKSGNHHFRFSLEVEQLISQSIQDIYLAQENVDSQDILANIHAKILELGLTNHKIPTIRTIQRRINMLDPYVVLKAKKGVRFANKQFKAAGRSIHSPSPMAVVEIDTHYLDIIIIDELTGATLGRPFLSCAIDINTRVIVGFYINLYPPSALTTLCVIKNMITRPNNNLPGGVPGLIVPDNGIEFKNNSFSRLCETLKITITPSQIGTPNNKPHIESFFRTLTQSLVQKLPGTTFSNPNMKGEYDSVNRAKMTLTDIRHYVEQWIHNIYHTHIHSQTNRAPILAWEDATKLMKPLSFSEQDANILCRKPHQCTINKGRVLINYLYYFSHALSTLEQKNLSKVTVLVDEMDLSKVFVIDPINKHNIIIAESTDPEYTKGLNSFAHKEARNIKKLMAKEDIQRLGKNTNLYARWKLLEKIQHDLQKKKPKLKKLIVNIPEEMENLTKIIPQPVVIRESIVDEIQSDDNFSFDSMDI